MKTTKRAAPQFGFIDHGKIPPQALDLEEVVLGAMMLEPDSMISVISKLRAEMFYKEQNQHVYSVIASLFSSGCPVDILTVTEKLRTDEKLDLAGGPYYVTLLTNRISSTANLEFHAAIIIQKYISREGIRRASEFVNALYEESIDVFDSFAATTTSLISLMNTANSRSAVKVSELFSPAVQKIRELSERKIEYIGIPSGILALDHITLGFQKTTLTLIASRPGMGKTALLISIAKNICKNHIAVGVFELEMSREQLMNRLISAETAINHRSIVAGKLESDEVNQVELTRVFFDSMPMFIDDTAGLTLMELRAKSIDMVSRYNCKIIFIDYLQLMRSQIRGRSREEEVSEISRGIKQIAKELDIPIIALAQLSRETERRANKKPELSDLRESGSLEQDADIVAFLYRPEYYSIAIDESGFPFEEGHTELIIAKHRSGPIADVSCLFKRELMRFEDSPKYLSSLNPFPKYSSEQLKINILRDNDPF